MEKEFKYHSGAEKSCLKGGDDEERIESAGAESGREPPLRLHVRRDRRPAAPAPRGYSAGEDARGIGGKEAEAIREPAATLAGCGGEEAGCVGPLSLSPQFGREGPRKVAALDM
jgi:hypothetical protein